MEKHSQYLLGGFVMLVFILLQYTFNNLVGSPYLFPFPFALLALALVITGIFKIKKYYNKPIYLITIFLILLATLLLTYLNSPISDLNRIIMAELLITLAFFLLCYDFIHHINESKAGINKRIEY